MKKDFETILKSLLLQGPNRGDRSRTEADVRLLLNRGVDSFAALVATADNPRVSSRMRSVACRVLGQTNHTPAVPALLTLLGNGSPLLSWEAAKALVTILPSANKASRQLKHTLVSGRGSHNRAGAAYVLGLLGTKSALPPLIHLLQTSLTPEVRSHAAEALGNIGEPSATEPLIPALRDRSSRVRLAAIYALGEAGDETAIAPLKRLVGSRGAGSGRSNLIGREANQAIKRIRRRQI